MRVRGRSNKAKVKEFVQKNPICLQLSFGRTLLRCREPIYLSPLACDGGVTIRPWRKPPENENAYLEAWNQLLHHLLRKPWPKIEVFSLCECGWQVKAALVWIGRQQTQVLLRRWWVSGGGKHRASSGKYHWENIFSRLDPSSDCVQRDKTKRQTILQCTQRFKAYYIIIRF